MLSVWKKTIAYSSRTMNGTGRNYAMKEKEALSWIFEVRKCYQYLAGKRLKII